MKLILALSASLLMLTGCPMPLNQNCNVNSRVSTRVAITHIGTGSRKFEVRATGFTPNAQARLTIQNFPRSAEIDQTVTLDAAGSLLWTTDAPLLLAGDPAFEPDAEVTTTLVETSSKCFGAAAIKERDFAQL